MMKRETIVVADCACHRHDRKCMGSDSSRHHHGNRIGVEYRQHVGNNVSALANSGCSIPTQYVTDASAAERKAHHAALLLAYAMSKQVVLTVEGCVGPYPRIIGVEIRN